MLEITKIYLNNNYSNAILIRWDILDTAENMNEYVFNIYESFSPDEEFVRINPLPITELEFMYENTDRVDSSLKTYIKVEVENIATGDKKMSAVFGATYLTPYDEIADTIIYQHNVFLEYILGRPPVKLLVKRRSGTRCLSCWDSELLEVTKSNCIDCYAVGYSGGYLPPKNMYISFTEPGFATRFDIDDVRDIQQGVTQAWCGNYPLVLPEDIIVDEFNRRFIVIQSQPTTKSGQIYLRQMLQLQLIPPTDIVYRLEL